MDRLEYTELFGVIIACFCFMITLMIKQNAHKYYPNLSEKNAAPIPHTTRDTL